MEASTQAPARTKGRTGHPRRSRARSVLFEISLRQPVPLAWAATSRAARGLGERERRAFWQCRRHAAWLGRRRVNGCDLAVWWASLRLSLFGGRCFAAVWHDILRLRTYRRLMGFVVVPRRAGRGLEAALQ